MPVTRAMEHAKEHPMGDLITMAREYDLPPRWDGRPVEWEGWRDLVIHVCGSARRPRDVCRSCGSTAPSVMNVGTVRPLPGETFSVSRTITKTAPRSGRKYDKQLPPVQKPAWPLLALIAFRCPDCRADVVWDSRTDEWWDLDHTDYGPEGSAAP